MYVITPHHKLHKNANTHFIAKVQADTFTLVCGALYMLLRHFIVLHNLYRKSKKKKKKKKGILKGRIEILIFLLPKIFLGETRRSDLPQLEQGTNVCSFNVARSEELNQMDQL